MNGKTFVDTNILVYAHDLEAGKMHEAARKRIDCCQPPCERGFDGK